MPFSKYTSSAYVRRGTKKRMSSRGSAQFRTKGTRQRSRRSSTMPRKVKGLTRQVKELKRLSEADMGTHIHRVRSTMTVEAGPNFQHSDYIVASDVGRLEDVLARLQYYDPSNPTTLLTASGNVGSYHKEFYFSRVHSKLTVRNNYQVPVMVRIYQVTPKDDTSIDPVTAFTTGLTDVGNPASGSPLVFLTDSKQFGGDIWRVQKSQAKYLDAGRQCTMSWSAKPFQYDPSLVDAHNQLYQAAYKPCLYVVFVKGIIAHDALAGQQGTCSSGVDVMCDTVFQVSYPAGADIHQVTVDDESDAFSNGARLTNKPASDVQAFARA